LAERGFTRVAAVVVNWRQPELTSAAVASLEAQEGLVEAGIDLSIVIVDNGSGDGSADQLSTRHPSHRLIALEHNRGFGGGVNAAIHSVDADVVVLLNNDAEADGQFVASLCAPLSAHPRVAAVTARILLRDAVDGVLRVNSTGNELTRSGNGRDRDWLVPLDADFRPAGDVAGFSGGAAALRMSALRELGLFDESLFMYYEDTDLSWRMRRRGWSIRYEPSAVVTHAHAGSSGTESDLFRFWNDRNRIVVAARHTPLPVLARALARTTVRAARTVVAAAARRNGSSWHAARRTLRALTVALGALPSTLRERRRIDRDATVPRHTVAAFIVPD
jgi:GT2 family glycosyltransferase